MPVVRWPTRARATARCGPAAAARPAPRARSTPHDHQHRTEQRAHREQHHARPVLRRPAPHRPHGHRAAVAVGEATGVPRRQAVVAQQEQPPPGHPDAATRGTRTVRTPVLDVRFGRPPAADGDPPGRAPRPRGTRPVPAHTDDPVHDDPAPRTTVRRREHHHVTAPHLVPVRARTSRSPGPCVGVVLPPATVPVPWPRFPRRFPRRAGSGTGDHPANDGRRTGGRRRGARQIGLMCSRADWGGPGRSV